MLVARLVDRPLRPMFEKGWSNDTQARARSVRYLPRAPRAGSGRFVARMCLAAMARPHTPAAAGPPSLPLPRCSSGCCPMTASTSPSRWPSPPPRPRSWCRVRGGARIPMTWAPAAPAGVRAPCLRCADLLLNKVVAAPHLSHPTAIPPPHTDIPLKKAVAGVRVALLGAPRSGLWVVNPTAAQMAASRLDLVMAGTKDAVLMIEGFCDFLSEEEMLEGIGAGAKAIAGMCEQMEAWAAKVCARGRGVSAAGQEGAGVCTCWQLPRAEHKPTPPVARLRMPPPPPPPPRWARPSAPTVCCCQRASRRA